MFTALLPQDKATLGHLGSPETVPSNVPHSPSSVLRHLTLSRFAFLGKETQSSLKMQFLHSASRTHSRHPRQSALLASTCSQCIFLPCLCLRQHGGVGARAFQDRGQPQVWILVLFLIAAQLGARFFTSQDLTFLICRSGMLMATLLQEMAWV